MSEGGDAEGQAEEEKDENRADHIEIRKGLPFKVRLSAGEQTKKENKDADGHAYPHHKTPTGSFEHQTAQGWAEYDRAAGDEHIEGKALCHGIRREFRDNI